MQVQSIGFRQQKIPDTSRLPDTSNPDLETVLMETTEPKAVKAKKSVVRDEEFSMMLKSRFGLHPQASQKQLADAIMRQCLRK